MRETRKQMFKNWFKRNTLSAHVQRVVALTADAEPDPERLWNELQGLCQAASQAAPTERDAALTSLAPAVAHSHPQVSGMVAIAGGALVGAGAPAALWAEPLRRRASAVLEAAGRFAASASARMGPPPEDDEDEEEWEDGALIVEERVVPPALVDDLARLDLPAVSAYRALELWTPPLLACLARSTEQRNAAAQDKALRDSVENLASYHGGMEMLWKLLGVLDQEPLLVLHPESGKGFVCRISGIGINFELHMLLMDVLCSPDYGLPGRRLAPNVSRVAWGRSVEEIEAGCIGNWNLYAWHAASLDLSRPAEVDDATWIWNEGTPADIPVFEGHRVVLLGTPPYERSWSVGRYFEGLVPQFTVERVLEPGEVASWLERLRAAAKSP